MERRATINIPNVISRNRLAFPASIDWRAYGLKKSGKKTATICPPNSISLFRFLNITIQGDSFSLIVY
jgi:hypothetical protein